MWDQGGQPWPQWPLSQQQWMQSFQHQQDPGQVDWAALAQAWIAQKESTGAEQHNIQPNGQDIPGIESVGQSNHGAFQGDPAFGRMWQPGTQPNLSQGELIAKCLRLMPYRC
uniref:Uncharacterized protein n=1 Tax=Amphiprion percula TaxID=161767 RepID=A0A3P8U1I4_AMPPE